MAHLTDNKLLLFGGLNKFNSDINDTWIFDISENTWTEVKCSNKPSPRELFAMSYIDEGKVILFGGFNNDIGYSNETWLFDIKKMDWEKLNLKKSPTPREGTSFAYLGDNKMLIFSGDPWDGPERFIPETWIYDNNKQEWDSIKYESGYPIDRELGMMTNLNEYSILLYGGHGGYFEGGDVNDTWIYDRIQGKWNILYPKSENLNRGASSMAKLQDNYCVVFGGNTIDNVNSKPEDQWSNDTWVYDGVNNTWIEMLFDFKPSGRYFHSMANISESKVILFGGSGYGDLNSTWLFEFEPNSVKENGKGNLIDFTQKEDEIEIHLIGNENNILKVVLYDYTGNLIDEYKTENQQNIKINIENHPSGAYILQVSTPKFNWNKMFIK
jgi:hypothetical protein